MLALVIAEGFVVALLGVLVAGLLRSHGDILRALHELGASLDPDAGRRTSKPLPVSISQRPDGAATAYDITGTTLDNEFAALGILGAPQRVLLAFLSSGCATCGNFWSAFADRQLAIPGHARLVIVAKDAAEENPPQLRKLAPPEATLVLSSAAWAEYQVPASPYFVYVDGASGRVLGEGTAAHWPQVAALMQQAIADAPPNRTRAPAPRPATADPDTGDHIDRELLRAGIGPGHPSLYGGTPAEQAAADGTAG